VVSTKPATKQLQKFVAATDTAIPHQPLPPASTATDDDKTTTMTTSSVAATSASDVSVEDKPKDEIDMKLQDFLAVSCHWLT